MVEIVTLMGLSNKIGMDDQRVENHGIGAREATRMMA